MSPRRAVLFAALLAIAGPAPAAAQWRSAPGLSAGRLAALSDPAPLALDGQRVQEPPSALAVSLAGVAGAAVGSIAGAYLGYHLDYSVLHWDCENGCEDPGLVGALGGWFVGSALTTPLSANLANGRRGSLAKAYLPAALIAGSGLGLLLAVGSPEGGVFLLAAPVAQVVSAVVTERRQSLEP